MNRLRRWLIPLALISGGTQQVWGYEPALHQQLTFIAARQFNICVQDASDIRRLSALDSRYVVKAIVAEADANVFVRMVRWDYYNREDQTNRTTLGFVDTRFHKHFDELVIRAERSNPRSERLRHLGRILNHIQNVSSPAHAVPVYTGRWWRLSFGDRFNRYPIDTDLIESRVRERCAEVLSPPATFQEILVDSADATAEALRRPIRGFPVTWESFWKFARTAEGFGEYGPAGNAFGERTEFPCGQRNRCLLLKNDPLYEEFSVERHVDAVIATMRALVRLQIEESAL